MATSPRHHGTVTRHVLLPATRNPRRSRVARTHEGLSSTPNSPFTAAGRKLTTCGLGSGRRRSNTRLATRAPAICCNSPTARSSASGAACGGSPFSNSSELSEMRLNRRLVLRTVTASKVADSSTTLVVLALTPLDSVPITPASATAPPASAMTRSEERRA